MCPSGGPGRGHRLTLQNRAAAEAIHGIPYIGTYAKQFLSQRLPYLFVRVTRVFVDCGRHARCASPSFLSLCGRVAGRTCLAAPTHVYMYAELVMTVRMGPVRDRQGLRRRREHTHTHRTQDQPGNCQANEKDRKRQAQK